MSGRQQNIYPTALCAGPPADDIRSTSLSLSLARRNMPDICSLALHTDHSAGSKWKTSPLLVARTGSAICSSDRLFAPHTAQTQVGPELRGP